MLLQRRRDRRLAGARQTREPDGAAALVPVQGSLFAREGRVPCDVAELLWLAGRHVHG